MLVAIYMSAILCAQIVGKDSLTFEEQGSEFDAEMYFGNIIFSMLTLWECLNDGCTADVVRPVVMVHPVMTLFFLAFTMVMVFGFLNILVGVFVDGTLESAKEQEEKIVRQKELTVALSLRSATQFWIAMDEDRDGWLTMDEFLDAFDN